MTAISTAFEGTAAIITGGGSGIGAALGAELAACGARVVLADIDGEAAHDVAGRISTGTGRAEGRQLDVRDHEQVSALVSAVAAEHGSIDLMFNNAGISMGGPTHELSAAHWDRAIDVNLRGVTNGVAAAYPLMVAQGHGHIVNTASGAGLVGPPLVAPYATAKHAVVGLTTTLRPEAALHGVRVSVLCPGAVETPILDRPPPEGLPPVGTVPVTARTYLRHVHQRPIAADRFARAALRAVARNRAIVVIPRSTKSLWYLQRLSPPATDWAMRKMAASVVRTLVRPAAPEADASR